MPQVQILQGLPNSSGAARWPEMDHIHFLAGLTPASATILLKYAPIAQLEEHFPCKEDVAGSMPARCSIHCH